MFTGMRCQDIVGLDWAASVDLPRCELRILESKTDAGRRRIALDDRSVGALVAWQIAQAGERAAVEAVGVPWADTGLVFTMPNGRGLKPQYVTRLFERIRVQADLPKITLHGGRHEHASLQLAAGTPVEVVSKRLGHKSTAITADLYRHLLRSTEHYAANAASALVPARKRALADPTVHTSHTHGAQDAEEAASDRIGNRL